MRLESLNLGRGKGVGAKGVTEMVTWARRDADAKQRGRRLGMMAAYS
jgi:hypothetical protein